MKQLVQHPRGGGVALIDAPAPVAAPGHLLVDVRASLISAGTERMVTGFAEKSLLAKARARPDLVRQVKDKVRRDGIRAAWEAANARLNDPLPLGYSAAGVVAAVGEGLEGRFHPGDRVAIGGAGAANHAERDLVPGNLAVPLPDGVTFDQASFCTLAAIALHSVRLVRPQLGEWVGVVGVGLVGLLAVQFARLSGARVLAIDYDGGRLALAESLGATAVWNLAQGDPAAAAFDLSGGFGCDSVVIAAATEGPEPLETAAAIARDRATVALVGITGTAFPYRAFMHKELNIVVARSYGPGRYDAAYERRGMAYPEGYVRWTETENLRTVAALLADGCLNAEALITHRFPLARAETAYRLIGENDGRNEEQRPLGVVLSYPEAPPKPPAKVHYLRRESLPRPEGCVAGVIGAGHYARTVFLPRLAAARGVTLHTVASARGLSAAQARENFGFEHAVCGSQVILDDPAINAVFILSPHSTHAPLTAAALAAGKSVFVEKPLAIDWAGIDQVLAARETSGGFLQVGFNRRLAPFTREAQAILRGLAGRKHIVIRANAGVLPPDDWQHEQDQGGGRLLGEACHFVDLAQHMAGSPITAVQATAAAGSTEDVGAHLEFADGSIATIAYTALGDTAFSKEAVEVFCAGQVIRIDNFRELLTVRDGRTKRKRGPQDKGHAALIAGFCEAVATGGPPPIAESDIINTSLAVIALKESLRQGRRVRL